MYCYPKCMPEFQDTLDVESDGLTIAQRENARAANRLSEPFSGPRRRMSIGEIQEHTAVFRTDPQPTSTVDAGVSAIDEPTDTSWLLPPHLALFYKKMVVTSLLADNMKQYVLDALRSHDAVFILSVRKNIGMPNAWLTALETLKERLFPSIDFDHMCISAETDETFGWLYVDGKHFAIPLDHDNDICTTDDALVAELELYITRFVPPVNARCRGVQREVERLMTAKQSQPSFMQRQVTDIGAEPPVEVPLIKKTTRHVDPSDVFLAKWEAEAKVELEASKKARLAVIRSSSLL